MVYNNLCIQAAVYNTDMKEEADMKNRIGSPDLLIVFTHTISHKMVQSAMTSVPEETKVVRSHTSSMNSLHDILKESIA